MFALKKSFVRSGAPKALAAIWLAVTVPSLAEPFKEASEAWDRGDYVAAMQVYRPLADRGNAEA